MVCFDGVDEACERVGSLEDETPHFVRRQIGDMTDASYTVKGDLCSRTSPSYMQQVGRRMKSVICAVACCVWRAAYVLSLHMLLFT
jgi:hypothetical protein